MTPEEVRKIPIEEVPFHGGFRPANVLDEGFQPEGDRPVPGAVPRLASAIVPPESVARPAMPPAGKLGNDNSPNDD